MKPSIRMAEWIAKQMDDPNANADDVYDVLLENITTPADFVREVQYWADEYAADFRRHNV